MASSDVATVIYFGNPYREAATFAEHIKRNSSKDDTVAVLGSEPQIFFYSGRKSATSYIYMYPLTELHKYAEGMQREVAGQIESARPKFLVLTWARGAWYNEVDNKIEYIFDWSSKYVANNYLIEGFVDLDTRNRYYWGKEIADVPRDEKNMPKSGMWMALYRRKDGGGAIGAEKAGGNKKN